MATRTTGRAGQAARATAGTEAIEVKVTIAERHEDNALRKFGLTRGDAEQRRIFFYDTPKLDLYKKGLALRAREMKGDECDSTVKIRPVEPDQVDAKWRKKGGFKLEADAVGKKVIRSASFSTPQQPKEIEAVASGARPIEKLFTGDQEEFLNEMSPVTIDFSKLVALGPVAARRWKFKNAGLPYELCAEEWLLPDGRDLIEISLKTKVAEAAAAQAALEGFLDELGFAAETGQQTKTRIALEYFAKRS
jgi:hypothetical protein